MGFTKLVRPHARGTKIYAFYLFILFFLGGRGAPAHKFLFSAWNQKNRLFFENLGGGYASNHWTFIELNNSTRLNNITSDRKHLNKHDVELSIDILEKVVHVENSTDIGESLVNTVSNVLKANKTVLDESEMTNRTGTRYVRVLEKWLESKFACSVVFRIIHPLLSWDPTLIFRQFKTF